MSAPAKLPKITTMSAREFNQHTGRAKKAAKTGPVVITDRGDPAYVLMTHNDYERVMAKTSKPRKFVSILEALEQKGGPEYDFEIELPKREVQPIRDPFES